MAELSDAEKQLQDRIGDENLRTSLVLIRAAATKIWAVDAPRIIQDYTDHGTEHSRRLAEWALKLLAANLGRALSDKEAYLLLAGIYLHDIGMQCDMVKYPEVRERAEAMGARFDVPFTAPLASAYSLDEQKALRANHHYLAAAWIDYARETGDTVLGPAAEHMPDDLVGDLMDVCMYHAKLSIDKCDAAFNLDPTGRKQLVAGLLRFADELDVDRHRVSIETVKNFRLDPHNAVYWWLHNLTKVIIDHNVILLTVRLHPDDAQRHGTFVHQAFIDEFEHKNRAVITMLAKSGIPLIMSGDSKVVEYKHAKRLPPEIIHALQEMEQNKGQAVAGSAPKSQPAGPAAAGPERGSPYVVHLRVYGEPPRGVATYATLNWSDKFDREVTPRRIPDPATWRDKLLPQLKRLKKKIGAPASIRLEGSASLVSGFAFGHTFSAVGQYHLQVVQTRGGVAECWGSDEQLPSGATTSQFARHFLPGDPSRADAVVMVLALPGTRPEAMAQDVGTYWDEPDVFAQGLQREAPPAAGTGLVASRWLKGGMLLWADVDPTRGHLAGWEAAALARTSVAQIREFVGQIHPANIHLFLATSIGLAVFLGHQWNAIGVAARCYEKVGGDRIYAPACVLELS